MLSLLDFGCFGSSELLVWRKRRVNRGGADDPHQRSIVGDNIISDGALGDILADRVEEFLGTIDFFSLKVPQLHRRHRALSFRYEVNVPYASRLE